MQVETFNFGSGSPEANTVISQGYRINDTIYISGQFSHDEKGKFVGVGDFATQARTTLANIDRVLAGFKLKRSNISELVVYLTDPRKQSDPLIPILQAYLGDHRPAGTVIGTTGLFYPDQLIEIRVVAHTD
ncbi:RidA family protein [Sphingomonas sp. PAMC 26605]|uniref:RidA family protein n=1 Tax=Sphingomonas sp. PAMC 26605 TaxID=1112214 RepID=UPI000494FF7F